MSVGQPSAPLRLLGPPDLGDLIHLAAHDNPFLRQDQVLEREIVTDRMGLLVISGADGETLLYVWTQPIEDISSWLAHAAHWLDRYPLWRKAHGLTPSIEPVRMVLAAPDIGDRTRSALRLISCRVALARYAYAELGGQAALAWETGLDAAGSESAQPPGNDQQAGERAKTRVTEDLTMEELAFFRTA